MLFLAPPMVRILTASEQDIDGIAPLFDSYRVFYEQTSDLAAATQFIKERLSKNEAVIFLAAQEKEMVGFTQLYRSFSSVSLQPVLILNDLFVKESNRKSGIGSALLHHAKRYCKEHGFKGLALETTANNPAQHLYERHGWEKDVHCFHYFWTA